MIWHCNWFSNKLGLSLATYDWSVKVKSIFVAAEGLNVGLESPTDGRSDGQNDYWTEGWIENST